jgi:hypothetical protein
MGRQRSKPKPKAQPPADISPFDSDEEDDDVAGGGIPDDDGWIHLREKQKEPERENKTPKRKPTRRRS